MAYQCGRIDVDVWLDEQELSDVIEARAYLEVVGTDEWRQAGMIASGIANLAIAAGNAVGDGVEQELTAAEDFIPLMRDIKAAVIREHPSVRHGEAEAEAKGA